MKKEILVLEDLLGSNKKIAAEIREKLISKGILTINLMGSPGAGKTTLLESIAEGAELDITEVPCKVECQECGTVAIKNDYVFICEKCGSTNIKTLEGMEMILEKMEIEI